MSTPSKIPDAVDRLLALPPFVSVDDSVDALFLEALQESIRSHAAGNAMYAAFLAKKGFDPSLPLTDVKALHSCRCRYSRHWVDSCSAVPHGCHQYHAIFICHKRPPQYCVDRPNHCPQTGTLHE